MCSAEMRDMGHGTAGDGHRGHSVIRTRLRTELGKEGKVVESGGQRGVRTGFWKNETRSDTRLGHGSYAQTGDGQSGNTIVGMSE